MSDWRSQSIIGLEAAIKEFELALPGWWWSIGVCSVSAHASCGPDAKGLDAYLLDEALFDSGFHADLAQPAFPSEALQEVREQALKARKKYCMISW